MSRFKEKPVKKGKDHSRDEGCINKILNGTPYFGDMVPATSNMLKNHIIQSNINKRASYKVDHILRKSHEDELNYTFGGKKTKNLSASNTKQSLFTKNISD